MNIQIFAIVGGNSSTTRLAYNREYLIMHSRKLYNKANMFDGYLYLVL